jgi:hypothetical protein
MSGRRNAPTLPGYLLFFSAFKPAYGVGIASEEKMPHLLN